MASRLHEAGWLKYVSHREYQTTRCGHSSHFPFKITLPPAQFPPLLVNLSPLFHRTSEKSSNKDLSQPVTCTAAPELFWLLGKRPVASKRSTGNAPRTIPTSITLAYVRKPSCWKPFRLWCQQPRQNTGERDSHEDDGRVCRASESGSVGPTRRLL